MSSKTVLPQPFILKKLCDCPEGDDAPLKHTIREARKELGIFLIDKLHDYGKAVVVTVVENVTRIDQDPLNPHERHGRFELWEIKLALTLEKA